MNIGTINQELYRPLTGKKTNARQETRISFEADEKRLRDKAFKKDDLVSRFWNMTDSMPCVEPDTSPASRSAAPSTGPLAPASSVRSRSKNAALRDVVMGGTVGQPRTPENGKDATWGKWRLSTETRWFGGTISWVLVERSVGDGLASINM